MPTPSLNSLGHIIEGVIERDPLTGRVQIMTVEEGRAKVTDVLELLEGYEGKEVRLTLASFENLATIAQMVEAAGGGQVSGVLPDDLPGVPFNIARRSS
jgi:hypothetical protein